MQSNEEFVKFLGEGAYGFVDLVRYTTRDGSYFHAAVKHSYADDFDNLERELQILCELRGCPRIVKCFGDCLEEGFSSDGNKVYKLFLEYASEGSLSAFMDNYSDRKLPEPMIRDFTRMILQGLVWIHRHGYVHCDLKSDNLLVFPSTDSSYELKISDFGNSLEVGEIPHYWGFDYPFVGTPIYMSPESLFEGVVNKTLDLWSLGCLVLEMYTGEIPWPEVDEINELALRLLDEEAPEIPESVPCAAREFIEKCFSRKPEERGSAYELLFHRFLDPEEVEEKITAVVDEEKAEKITAVVEEEKITAVVDERRNSFLLKLKLRIRRAASKKSTDVTEKKPLKLKIFPSKAPQFKNVLKKILRLKTLDSNLVCVK